MRVDGPGAAAMHRESAGARPKCWGASKVLGPSKVLGQQAQRPAQWGLGAGWHGLFSHMGC